MPGRQVNLRGPKDEVTRKPKPKKKSKRGGLDALAIAEKQFPLKTKIRQSRLGEVEDFSKRKRQDEDGPDIKRRRTENETSEFGEDGGSDSEGHEWKLGEVNSEDDSELDSDDAFGESDEERFEGFTFRGSSSGTKSKAKRSSASTRRNREIDLSEDVENHKGSSDDDSEDDLGEDAVDLATAWDMNAEDDEESGDPSKSRKHITQNSTDVSDAEASESDDDGEDDDLSDDTDLSVSDAGDDGDAKSGLLKLQSFVNDMETTTAGKSSHKGNRGQENGAPTEYGLTSTRKLTVADLIPSITDSRLKSSLKHLDAATASRKSKSGVNGKLAAPLPKRQQDRIDRAVAYEKSKETLDRWIDTVKTNRQAEHLSFPLPDPEVQQLPRIGPVKPQTDLESTIQTILVESGLAEKSAEDQIKAAEELETRQLSLEEIRARTAELRKRRELLFREEVRAKRIKKIKSKAYRRVHRKQRQKMEQLERQALTEAGVDLDEEERERNDRQRAEARMGAKHKESKWAKSLKQTGRAAWDEDARLSMADMARRDDELQKRIEGKRVHNPDDDFLGSSSSESEDDGDPWNEEYGSEAETRKLDQDLDALGGADDVTNITGPHSKLLSMKFMQKAEAARKLQNDEEIKELRRELNGDDSDREEVEGGRRKFGRSQAESSKQQVLSRSKNEFEEHMPSDDEEVNILESIPSHLQPAAVRVEDKKSKPTTRASQATTGKEDNAPEENPWLTQTTRNNRRRTAGNTDETVDISLEGPGQVSTVNSQAIPRKDSPRDEAPIPQPRGTNNEDDEASESDDDARTPVLLKNHDLVKKAFAGDDVVEDFEKEKLETIKEEGDQVIDNTLPGWGNWAGAGISKKQEKRQRRFLTTVEGVKPEQRKDAKLAKVIINEKRVRKVWFPFWQSVCNFGKPLTRS
jgi:U3 small nucleolar RNA-associated protein 14